MSTVVCGGDHSYDDAGGVASLMRDASIISSVPHIYIICIAPFSRRGNSLRHLPPLSIDSSYPDTSDTDSVTAPDTQQDNMVWTLLKQTGRGKVGYLSLVMLVLFTFSNSALQVIDAQLHRIDSHDVYDTLSAEVISPPTRYTKPIPSERPRMGLATAAISSVTEALSPILPFTGGVDLRREEHWDTSEGWINAATAMIDQVRDAFGLEPWLVPRGGSLSAHTGNKTLAVPSKRGEYPHVFTLSASAPFVPVSAIADMTLGDLSAAFQYAIESTHNGFNEKRFLDGVDVRMRPIISGLKEAAIKSRGFDVEPAATVASSSTLPAAPGDNVDALHFCAAMRLFAEWRVVRQVPDGYKGFAVGMNLGQKDIVQNVAKIEKAVHDWLDYRRDLLSTQSQSVGYDAFGYNSCPIAPGNKGCNLRSPTLRQLLEHEVQMNVHDNSRLPRLKDKTGAMGLLWVRRQLQYQTALFANILQVPTKFSSANSAVTSAYTDVYGKFHGWAVQKIFGYSFQAAPEVDVIYRYMNPHHLKVVTQRARRLIGGGDGGTNARNDLNPFQKIWANVVDMVNDNSKRMDGGDSRVMVHQEDEAFVSKEMTEAAHKHISMYLDIVQPVLGDLAGLFDDLNMDDPTKV